MLRSATRLATLAAALGLAGAADAQSRPPPARIYARVEDPAGNPVAGATGWLLPEPGSRLEALPSPLPGAVRADEAPERWRTETSDARGLLRFGGDGWRPGAGSGLVTTTQGLGAVLPRLFARRLQQVTLEPMAELTTPTGSEAVTVYARARLADGHRVALPPQSGTRIRLPEGDYELWANSADGWTWQRVTLRSGERAVLRFEGVAQRLRVAPDTYLHPRGWTTMPLRRAGDPLEVLLRGSALRAELVSWTGDGVTQPLRLPQPATVAPLDWPPDARAATRPLRAAIPDATWFGLVREAGGRFRLVARAVADARGVAALPENPGGDSWLLATGAFAPAAAPWSDPARAEALRAARGVELVARARGPQQLPVVDLICRYVPDGMPAAAVIARTDATGVARFGRCIGPGELRVEDPRYANQRRALESVPVDGVALEVDRGASCSGVATFADGFEGGAIVITLRDPRGALRPADRTQTVAPGEAFSFEGLPAAHDFVLVATALRDGKTWAARRIASSGGAGLQLELADEDPSLGR